MTLKKSFTNPTVNFPIVFGWICRCMRSFQQLKKEYAALRKKLEAYFQVSRLQKSEIVL